MKSHLESRTAVHARRVQTDPSKGLHVSRVTFSLIGVLINPIIRKVHKAGFSVACRPPAMDVIDEDIAEVSRLLNLTQRSLPRCFLVQLLADLQQVLLEHS